MSATYSSSLKRLLLLFVLTSGFKRNESQASAAPVGDIPVSLAGTTTTVYHADDGRCYEESISGSEVTCPVRLRPLPVSEQIPVTPVVIFGLMFSICLAMNYFIKTNQQQNDQKDTTSTELPPPEYCASLPEAQNADERREPS
ncbi:uncharacterized protein EV420DRAFT_1560457 [Desarmillaria tabescens]|uniref:Uncharacterized protein n=1 Tax=Armillaria tabescens TaxID=1929756 RepID=A0AA39MZ80_ARMTA|nr:uncharacterized protein EV420DRAFT_1560457 [Desarmillaria tabescens]KAK0451340.1 hypothetical protein EV420DRAFT_1560457 [Desarmillaria tabescens]